MGCPYTWVRKNIFGLETPKKDGSDPDQTAVPPNHPLVEGKEEETGVSEVISTAPVEEVPVKDMFSLTDISKHNSIDDCWITIKGNVYDLTNFISDHPDERII